MRLHRISIKFSILLLSGFLLSGCNRYLDVDPKGYTLLKNVEDYDLWMNDQKLWIQPFDLNYLSDFVDFPNAAVPATSPTELLYTWAPQYTDDAGFWGAHYSIINAYNSVINGVESAVGGTERQKKQLKAEALLGRAYNYLFLVNEYAKSYDSATAATDPGVPFVTSDDVAQDVPPRSSVKVVYDRIIKDITDAIPFLPEDNSKNRFRASVAAAYSVLARVYLNAHNYEKARESAERALQNTTGQAVIDYNAVANATALQPIDLREDVIFARTAGSEVYYPSTSFLKTFDVNDKRLRFFYTPLGDFSFPIRGGVYYFPSGSLAATNVLANSGTSVQEMKLIIAEAAARSGDLDEALKQLDEVRRNRITTANYVPYSSTDPEYVLEKVLEERRFEFPFNGIRWFDMRRLAAEGRVTDFTRLDAQGNIIARLEPNSARYTLQIPAMVLQYNPDMKQNP